MTLTLALQLPAPMTDNFAPQSASRTIARIRRWVLIVAAIVLWISSAIRSSNADDGAQVTDGPVVERVESQTYEQHGITITPARSSKITINGLTYDEVYDSIPHHRADALANPGYRHDATMEILFGELRPTTIVRHMPQQTTQPRYLRSIYGYFPYGAYIRPYGLSAYRWSVWDRYLYRHSAFMFGVH